MNVVRQADENSIFFKVLYPVACVHLFSMLYLMLDGLMLFLIFVKKDVFRMIFNGGILGSTRHCKSDPYLNSTLINAWVSIWIKNGMYLYVANLM